MVCLASQCGYIVDFEINKGITLFLKDVILRRFSEVPMETSEGVYMLYVCWDNQVMPNTAGISNLFEIITLLCKLYLIDLFFFLFRDLQGNNITVIFESDFQHLAKLRIL